MSSSVALLRRHSSFTVAAVLCVTALFAAPAAAQIVQAQGDGACPPGMAPLSLAQATAQRASICPQLGQWDILRLAGGGSMDGPGYQCQVRASDPRRLGGTLCAPAAAIIVQPPPPPPMQQRAIRVVAGVFDAVHPAWQDVVTLEADGSMWRASARRRGRGRWYVDGQFLVLDWGGGRGVADRLQRVGRGEFQSATGLRLVRRPDVVMQPPPQLAISVSPGMYDGIHPHWRDVVILAPDGTYARGSGDPGRWYVEGNELVLAWQSWGPERLTQVGPGSYRAANGFTLTFRGLPPPPPPPQVVISVSPGVYDGIHPHWRDVVILAPDGTYARGSGDAGRWYVEGNELVLAWQSWGPERLTQVGPGSYRAANGFTLTFRGDARRGDRRRGDGRRGGGRRR